MNNRIPEEAVQMLDRMSPAGFLLVPMAAGVADQASALQMLYQQMYEQAVQANQPRRVMFDLFANMN